MGDIISLVLFGVLSFLTFTHAMGRSKVVSYPFDKTKNVVFSGPEYFIVLLLGTAMFQCGMFLSTRLLINEILCIILFFRYSSNRSLSMPLVLYIVYMIWLVIGCTYTESMVFGIRMMIKYLYPFVVSLVCMKVVSHHEVFLKSGLVARKWGCVSVVSAFIPVVESLFFSGVMWYGTARVINYISLAIFSLTLFYHLKNYSKSDLFWAIFFMIPCFLAAYRTSVLGTFVAVSMFYVFKDRMKAIPVLAVICVIAVGSVFLIPSLREKTFYDKETTFEQVKEVGVEEEQINTNGRTALWKHLKHKFYEKHELVGSGTGSVQNEMYTNTDFYNGIKVTHGDYVQMQCDNGNIGMILYLIAMLSVVIHCFWVYNNLEHNMYVRVCAIAAGASLAGMLATLYSDNSVNYSMVTLAFPMAFYGMMLGLKYKEEDEEIEGKRSKMLAKREEKRKLINANPNANPNANAN
ncbi:MAG: O-antigen ligase family protein [Bacteroidaceae bacterium]|nr:O-antigen ligase family protein [Bacteroidaceae bacterium]